MVEVKSAALRAVVYVVAIMAMMTVLIVAILLDRSIEVDGASSRLSVTAAN